MDPTLLRDSPVAWLQNGPECDTVVSSRVRLARNIDGYPFIQRASDGQRARIEEEILHRAIELVVTEPPLDYVRLDTAPPLLRELLLERRLISAEHAEAEWVRSVTFERTGKVSLMVNEEDHLRLQVMHGGLCLDKVFEQADRLDDLLSERVPFAYSPRFGYLTTCPTNAGTGLRASVMLHLPGIVMEQEMDNVADIVRNGHLVLRGVYGEGTHGAGDFYQLSNHITLGPSEWEIISSVTQAARRVIELERAARADLRDHHPREFAARLGHALRLLQNACAISSQESLSFLSQVRLGVELGVLKQPSLKVVNDLLLLTLPAHLQTMEGRVLDTDVRNELRARIVRERIQTG